MLRRVEIENFKGVGERVELDLKPVTLLFGPNSAGKSTLLHAIHYAHAILQDDDTSPTTTPLGGDGLDLGGFPSLVHDHDLDRVVRLAFEYDVDDLDFEEFLVDPFERFNSWAEPDASEPGESAASPPPFIGAFRTAKLTLRVRWSPLARRAVVISYDVAIEGEHLASLEASHDGADTWLTTISMLHPALWPDGSPWASEQPPPAPPIAAYDEDETSEVTEEEQAWLNERRVPEDLPDRHALMHPRLACLPNRGHALPRWNRGLDIQRESLELAGLERELLPRLEALVIAAGGMLRNLLGRLRYVGPVRPAPPRAFRPPAKLRESRWANGMGAWDELALDEGLRGVVSHWLGRMKSPYVVDWEAALWLPEELHQDLLRISREDDLNELYQRMTSTLKERGRLVMRTESGLDLAPCDLGEGITWVVPIIAAALADRDEAQTRMVVIEQPELHIHPRMQVELGDLFIQASEALTDLEWDRRQFLIETHSEHLVLRVLRRVRETADDELPDDAPSASPDTAAVLHIGQIEGSVKVTPLRISKDGDFIDSWPDGFFEERAEELF